ncbi:MAG: ABC transporter substrate-binding protein, partial [Betaproteobacteria bacterium]
MSTKFGNRRLVLKALGIGAASAAVAVPGISRAQSTKVRVGYIHTVAVDGQIWAGDHIGSWKKEGLDMEFIKFDSGLAIFQAMVGGSL